FRNWGMAPSDNQYVWPASRHTWAMNEVQKFFIEQTRLGIPVDFTNEGIRGIESLKSTNFPTQLGLGHTWDRDLIRKVGAVTGTEAKALGYTNVYSPILDVARDQRWGRFEESYGESPYLVAELGIQMARGIQEDGGVAATAKHFLAYSANKGAREGLARTDPQISPREVEMIHAYPFRRVIQEASLMGIMCAYNDYDGIPIEGSSYWLTERLRGEMGFRGYVVSDSDAVEYLYSKHDTAADMKEAVLQSVEAGLNVRCTFRSPDSYVLPLRELVEEGAVSAATLDSRVRDILRVKFELGLFDSPYIEDLAQSDLIVGSKENQELALRAARESIVLLKNEGGLLPLERGKVRSIAVCGPNAAEESFAKTHYGPLDADVVSVLEGLQEGSGAEILYAKGCDLVDAWWPESEIMEFPLTEQEQAMIDEAVANALKADVSVVVLGGGIRTCGENKSRTSIGLPGRQETLLKAVCATGKPVILILINGRSLSVNWADANVPSILEAWYPGSYGGQALTEIIFGDCNPSGKLTCTFPRTVGQIPFNFPCKPNSQIGGDNKPGPDGGQSRINTALYNFGHGLSYTTFGYSDLEVTSSWETSPGHPVKVSLTVRNTGEREGDEIVQIYIRDILSSVTTYEKRLVGFERVHLAPGESRRVNFEIRRDAFELIDRNFQRTIEHGDFRIMAGASSDDIRLESIVTY
ncbi:MAG: glycoside hydrolase family 3 N-terminal domain-containing protein, partial [Candidatus Cryptobacteroides sp.]